MTAHTAAAHLAHNLFHFVAEGGSVVPAVDEPPLLLAGGVVGGLPDSREPNRPRPRNTPIRRTGASN